jgi:ubiquinone/menaquinone biosynthesis C-methylase UbiE
LTENRANAPRSGLGAKAFFVSKSIARRIRWAPSDLAHKLDRNADPLAPPRGISFVGHGDFREIGSWYVKQFEELGGLEPDDRVLDIGCGIGRMAVPLMDYLDEGSYDGFDTSSAMIRWCQKNITSKNPHFQFTAAPIHNRKYNPFGTVEATAFRFPYEDDRFDFSFATSLFTHLGLEETRHYLKELFRVLKPGAAALVTFFLLGGDGRPPNGRIATYDFKYDFGRLMTTNAKEPEAAVAYPESILREAVDAAGLRIKDPISYGRWPETAVGRDIQDMVVLHKPASD